MDYSLPRISNIMTFPGRVMRARAKHPGKQVFVRDGSLRRFSFPAFRAKGSVAVSMTRSHLLLLLSFPGLRLLSLSLLALLRFGDGRLQPARAGTPAYGDDSWLVIWFQFNQAHRGVFNHQ